MIAGGFLLLSGVAATAKVDSRTTGQDQNGQQQTQTQNDQKSKVTESAKPAPATKPATPAPKPAAATTMTRDGSHVATVRPVRYGEDCKVPFSSAVQFRRRAVIRS